MMDNTRTHGGNAADARLGGRGPGWAVAAALVGALVVFVAGFASGRSGLNGARSELRQARTEHEARLGEVRAETAKARTDLAFGQALNRLLTARGCLYRSAVQLERRNFGAAQGDLRRAALALENAAAGAATGIDAQAVSRLQEAVAGIDIRVATDVTGQRIRILQVVEQLDRLLGPGSQPNAAPG